MMSEPKCLTAFFKKFQRQKPHHPPGINVALVGLAGWDCYGKFFYGYRLFCWLDRMYIGKWLLSARGGRVNP